MRRIDHAIRRRGMVLLLVLVLIPVLALGAYSFNHLMRGEAQAAIVARRQVEARWAALGGIAYLQALLADPATFDASSPIDLINNPTLFAGQVIVDGQQTGTDGEIRFSVVSPNDTGTTGTLRFGLSSELSKIPLQNPELVTIQGLSGLPNMTEEIAAAIVDWIDGDGTPQEQGAEDDYYLSLSPAYRAANRAPVSVDELLLVRGVTPALLYGEDANRDGILNPNENDGDASWPPDNQDGELDRGWFPFLTTVGSSLATNSEGEKKTNLAGSDYKTIYEKLRSDFSEDIAIFAVTFRLAGEELTSVSSLIDAKIAVDKFPQVEQQLTELAKDTSAFPSDLANAIKRTVKAEPGAPPPREISSPWTVNNVNDYLDQALDLLSVSDDPVQGVVDVGNAPVEVLQCLPGMDATSAEAVANATAGSQGVQWPGPGFLLTQKLVTLEKFRQMERFVVTSSRTFRCEVVGYRVEGGPIARAQAIIDASKSPPEVVQIIDLTASGNGYPRGWLDNSGNSTESARSYR